MSDCYANNVNPLLIVEGTPSIVLTAYADDSTTGNHNIKAAEYFINTIGADGTGFPMAPDDTSFDSPFEAVIALVDTSGWLFLSSPYYVYIHGLDSANNWGTFCPVIVYVSEPSGDPTPTPVISFVKNSTNILLIGLILIISTVTLFRIKRII
ncbi:MAG: hypothetical protein A2161_06875 [Candidatus Schekmanbacteria bacterium RBG_13_48_7]|uniref:Uncharacterized protein n=1 Tax=Candidatus Schekmanbacteria bacterium RBG_13_48_7 TaxID=1817878 RepID=A0A1F7RLY8_9BACT|nr:MAG: hypothetical protein A2161_06875 [Candidatus Schekmanbacteria bacterium RBG_13_48_7]